MADICFCVCTYNRGENLRRLLPAMLGQRCSGSFEVLVVDNNSTDNTREIVQGLAGNAPQLRYVFEPAQGIVPARNRAIEESLASDYLVFIDDDELPEEGFLEAALDALAREGADCAGGRIEVDFEGKPRPRWLTKELLGFLAEVDYSSEPFWIQDKSRPLWTANIGYNTELFRGERGLRFDRRFNRAGQGVGGGEDAAMFAALVDAGKRLRYRPDMVTRHFVEQWRLKRRYFLKLHFLAGQRVGQYEAIEYARTVCNVPPFMLMTITRDWGRALLLLLKGKPAVRQAMNGAYACGMVWGRIKARRESQGQ